VPPLTGFIYCQSVRPLGIWESTDAIKQTHLHAKFSVIKKISNIKIGEVMEVVTNKSIKCMDFANQSKKIYHY
jgi:hypothetical protein